MSISHSDSSAVGLKDHLYERLGRPDEIRILELLPAKEGLESPIRCQLHQTVLRLKQYPYIAISYAWGDASPAIRKTIICNSGRIRITPNLYSILTRLRSLRMRYLWVDALCIDQALDTDALTERAQQVRLMDQIFSNAEKVVVDLGEMSEVDKIALNDLSRYQAISAAKWKQVIRQARSKDPNVDRRSGLDALNLPVNTSPFWSAFTELMNSPWFTRSWIIQDFSLAASVEILVDHDLHHIEFFTSGLLRVIEHLRSTSCWFFHSTDVETEFKLRYMHRVIRKPCNALLGILRTRQKCQSDVDRNRSFCVFFDRSRMFESSDWHDRAYSILALANDPDIDEIPVDYSLTVEELSHRLTQYFIKKGYHEYVLYNCLKTDTLGTSWHMNLKPFQQGELSNLIYLQGRCDGGLFNACGNTKSSLRVLPGDKIASTFGSILGSVTSMATTYMMVKTKYAINKLFEERLRDFVFQTELWMKTQEEFLCIPLDEFRTRCQTSLWADSTDLGLGYRRLRELPELLQQFAEIWAGLAQSPSDELNDSAEEPTHHRRAILQQFHERLAFSCGYRLGVTALQGLLCLLPKNTQLGDCIAIFKGCTIPFVVRRCADYYRMVGVCYIHDMMDGQALKSPLWNLQEIELR